MNNCVDMGYFSIFTENLKLASATHSYNTTSARNDLLFAPSYNSDRFGRKSIIHSTTLTWNHLQNKLTEYDILQYKTNKTNNLMKIVDFLISSFAII